MAKQARPSISAKIIAERDLLRQQLDDEQARSQQRAARLIAEEVARREAERKAEAASDENNVLRDTIHRLELEVERQKGYLQALEDQKPPEMREARAEAIHQPIYDYWNEGKSTTLKPWYHK